MPIFRMMGAAYYVESIELNEEYLKTIPLEERLVFYLSENTVNPLFHKSVMDTIMATNQKVCGSTMFASGKMVCNLIKNNREVGNKTRVFKAD